MAASCVEEVLPPMLDSTSDLPPLFDGTTRLYMAYGCPFAQRVWIIRNQKGLLEEIKLVAINLQNKPAWYKEKVHPEDKVPALEHNNKVIGESLDLLKYIDSNFGGPSLWPDVPAKQEVAEELLSYNDTLIETVYGAFKGDPIKEISAPFDHLESTLHKFDDGPFFLGQLSLVDIAFIPFIERFDIFLSGVWKYDLTAGRPKLAAWFEEMNKLDAYKPTKYDPKILLPYLKRRFLGQ